MKISPTALVELINANCDSVVAEIGEVYHDKFTGRKWMSIIINSLDPIDIIYAQYNLLTPGEHKRLSDGEFTSQDAQSIIDKINHRGW